jgi:hypothetical protein
MIRFSGQNIQEVHKRQLTVLLLTVHVFEFSTVNPMKKERRLRVLENRGLRRIFGPKGDEVLGE